MVERGKKPSCHLKVDIVVVLACVNNMSVKTKNNVSSSSFSLILSTESLTQKWDVLNLQFYLIIKGSKLINILICEIFFWKLRSQFFNSFGSILNFLVTLLVRIGNPKALIMWDYRCYSKRQRLTLHYAIKFSLHTLVRDYYVQFSLTIILYFSIGNLTA